MRRAARQQHWWVIGCPLAALLATLGCGGGGSAAGPAGPPVGRRPDATPPEFTVGGFEIQVPSLTVMPGDELLPCWIFPIDIQGPSRIVGGAWLQSAPGMHHGNLTTRKSTGTGIRECAPEDLTQANSALDIFEGGAVMFASSTQVQGSEWRRFPDGMGFRVPDGHEIIARLHYLNASPNPVTVAPRYHWYTIDESKLVQELAPFAWNYTKFEIPPMSDYTVSVECDFAKPMHIVELLPHMHKLGREFDAAYVGGPMDKMQFLHSPGYDPDNGVLLEYSPPIDLSQGLGATFSCTWHNTYPWTVHQGIGTDEMCILFGYAYPPAGTYSALASSNGSCLVGVAGPLP
jgi:hypothetical protein